MKKFNFSVALVCFMGISPLAWPQYVPNPAGNNNPWQPITKAQICARLNKQTAKINADSKVGKLTTDQANDLLSSLKTVKNQMKANYAENGKNELTNDQKTALSAMLDQTGGVISAKSGPKNYPAK